MLASEMDLVESHARQLYMTIVKQQIVNDWHSTLAQKSIQN